MTQKYGNWNYASYYSNCNRIDDCEEEFSTEKLLYGEDPVEIQVRNYHYSIDDFVVGSFENHILLRIAASNGLTKGQLEKYLLLQGLVFEEAFLNNRLYRLVEYGYLSLIIFRRMSDNKKILIYEMTDKGYDYLKRKDCPIINFEKEELFGKDIFRSMRTKMVSNQIVLKLLCGLKEFRSFYFQRRIGLKIQTNGTYSIVVPLYIQTKEKKYMFEFVGNTIEGKRIFQNRMEILLSIKNIIEKNTVLVIVAETYEHMQTMTTEMLAYEKRALGMDILYTHDSEWFYQNTGLTYAMVRAMGQSGLMSIKII